MTKEMPLDIRIPECSSFRDESIVSADLISTKYHYRGMYSRRSAAYQPHSVYVWYGEVRKYDGENIKRKGSHASPTTKSQTKRSGKTVLRRVVK
jgi:hypothetical protein